MKYQKVLLCIALAGSLVLGGCGSKSDTTDNTAADTAEVTSTEAESSESDAKDTLTGLIAEITDTQLTISTMSGGMGGDFGGAGGEMPDGAGGEAPDGADFDTEMGEAPDGAGGEMPDGDGGERPDDAGEAPDGDGGETPDSADFNTEMGEAPDGAGGKRPDDAGEAPDGNGGEAPDGVDFDTEMGEAPDGAGSGTPSDMSEMGTETVTVTLTDDTQVIDADGNTSDISALESGQMVVVEVDADNNALTITISDGTGGGEMMGSASGGGGTAATPESYTAVTEYTEDTTVSDETFTSTGTDENAILVSSDVEVTFNDITLTRTSSDSTGGDSSSFYGVGAGLLVTDGNVTVNGGTFETDAAGGAGIFAYGSGVVTVSDAVITTQQDTSGGIHVAGGGTLYASNLTITTSGESSAAIRSDRGGGTITVDGGSYTSNGTGSPAVYCTADITISDANLTANGSEAVCIEGLNSLTLENCNLVGNMPENEQNDCTWTVILYQSMSGDSEIGNSTFSMTGGSLVSQNGGLFYTTNTESTFYISDVDITPSASNDFLLKCTGNSNTRGWGTSGDNGADCEFTADAQIMEGSIIWDSISQLDVMLTNGTTWTGDFVQDESNAGNGGDGYADLSIDASSTWIVTGDSTLSGLICLGTIVDEDGNTVTIQGTDGTVYVDGTSSYTITVNEYSES